MLVNYNNNEIGSIWHDVNRLQNEFNKIFADLPVNGQFPAVNLYSNAEKAAVVAEIPGVHPENLDVTVSGDVVTISGERSHGFESDKDYEQYRSERYIGKFSRTFKLPYSIEADKVKAHIKNGVLLLELPRAESEKPRKVAVQEN